MEREYELDTIFEFAIELGRYGGHKISEGYNKGIREMNVQSKSEPSDLVTQYDQEIEKEVTKRIKTKFPDHKIIGEETDASGVAWTLTEEATWIIDPIDGTTNFVHGFPYVCISIAFVLNRIPMIGVVYNPILDELFTARKNHGAFLNLTRRLPILNPLIRTITNPAHCLLIGEFGGQRDAATMASKSSSLYNLSLFTEADGAGCRGIRCSGSAAMNLCMLAKGNADVYWEVGPFIWDLAAGLLILNEAGGFAVSRCTEPTFPKTVSEARKFDLMARTVLAVRCLTPIPTDRSRSGPESQEADQQALELLAQFTKYIKPVPLPESPKPSME